MDESKTNDIKPKDSKQPVYWIPFSVAAVLLVVVGLFRFSGSEDNAYFIYICLIAFALAALPWITSFRVNGLFEIERAIDKTKEETKDRIEQTDKRFEDRIFSLRSELTASLTSIQSQISQQSAILNSTQSQLSQQSTLQSSRQSNSQIIAIGDIVKALDNNAGDNAPSQSKEFAKVEIVKKDNDVELSQTDIEELKIGFAQSAAAALDDPLGLQCSKLIRQIPVSGLSLSEFNEMRLGLEISDEQVQTLKKLKLIVVSPLENEQVELIKVSNLGNIYKNYWKLNVDVSAWAKTLSNVLSFTTPLIMANLFGNTANKNKK